MLGRSAPVVGSRAPLPSVSSSMKSVRVGAIGIFETPENRNTMFVDSTFSKTQFLLERGLQTSSLRRQVIADNIANVDTPHFKRSRVTFESWMSKALAEGEAAAGEPQAAVTNGKHIPFFEPLDFRRVEPKLNLEYETNYRNDKNNVDIDREAADAAKNALAYSAYVTRISQNFRLLNSVMR